MRFVAQLVVVIYLAGGALAWSLYAAWIFAYHEMNAESLKPWTTWFIYRGGQCLWWAFGLIAASALVTAVVATVWKAVLG
jgi:hypothetical protein